MGALYRRVAGRTGEVHRTCHRLRHQGCTGHGQHDEQTHHRGTLEEEEQRKDERRGDYYGKDTFKNSNKKKRHNIYIFSLEDLDNDDIISMVETTPTFQRTKTVLESIQSKAIAEEEETFNNDAENGGITITF